MNVQVDTESIAKRYHNLLDKIQNDVNSNIEKCMECQLFFYNSPEKFQCGDCPIFCNECVSKKYPRKLATFELKINKQTKQFEFKKMKTFNYVCLEHQIVSELIYKCGNAKCDLFVEEQHSVIDNNNHYCDNRCKNNL